MLKLTSLFYKKTSRDFYGGVKFLAMKRQTSNIPLKIPPLPDKFIIPLKQHIGSKGKLIVSLGQFVRRGQALTSGFGYSLPVHAPTSGQIIDIKLHMIATPLISNELSIILIPDGKDLWLLHKPLVDYYNYSQMKLLDRIHQSGIAGLGGAGFPTAIKFKKGLKNLKTIIINASECEPYITADDRLIQECSNEIVIGINIIQYILQPKNIFFGIEDDKLQAISAIKVAIKENNCCKLRIISSKYPSGSANQLIQILTGQEVPYGYHSYDIGILVINVSTVYAIKRAIINGETLTERVLTLTGGALSNLGNIWARIGTPVNYLLQYANFYSQTDKPLIIMGGPLTGLKLSQLDVPIIKTSNCLLALSQQEISSTTIEQNCIRCGRCAIVCPVKLLPQELYWFNNNHKKACEYHLFDCIECGACTYVCPSNIPLVKYYRQQKIKIRALNDERKNSSRAKIRFNAKKNRQDLQKEHKYSFQYQQINFHTDHIITSVNTTKSDLINTNHVSIIDKKNILDTTIIGFDKSNRDKYKADVDAAIARVKKRKMSQKISNAKILYNNKSR